MKVDLIHQLKQDLQWAINSSPLVNIHNDLYRQLITSNEISERHLIEFFQDRHSHRVGRYFENLIDYWFRHILGFEIIADHLQIEREGRTIGELDSVIRNHNGQQCHYEMAVKFYLYLKEDNPTDSHFIGPNSRDNFEKKLDRMLTHQLPLGKEIFPELDLQQPFVKGRIFYRPDETKPTTLPDHLSPDHETGRWIYLSELEWLSTLPQEHRFQILDKPFWLRSANLDNLVPAAEIIQLMQSQIGNDHRPRLIACSPAPEQTTEFDYLFIVPNHWPAQKKH